MTGICKLGDAMSGRKSGDGKRLHHGYVADTFPARVLDLLKRCRNQQVLSETRDKLENKEKCV